ncbi:MAG: YybH family protein [Candidatus Sulfotelmatobacter sp.]
MPLVQPMVGALGLVCQFLNSATGGHMNPVTAHIRSCRAGVSHLFIFGILLVASVCVVSQDKQQAVNANAGKDEDDIKQLISTYAKAADEADPALASRIWCDSSDDSLINPVGRWHGVDQIMGFYRHDMGEMYSVRDLKISDVFLQVYSDAAWAEFNWNFSAKRRKEGSAVSFRGMETQIYRKNRDRWCLVHVHYSTMPAVKKGGTE